MARKIRKTRKERRKQRKIIIITSLSLLFIMSAGYAVFQTNLNIIAKGNVKDIKQEVDSKVPTEGLLFWGQADNSDNTTTILKDKSINGNDVTLYGATFNEDGLYFDGVDDYGVIDMLNYNNSTGFTIDFVAHMETKDKPSSVFESSVNQNYNDGAYSINTNEMYLNTANDIQLTMHSGSKLVNGVYNIQKVSDIVDYENFKHYTVSFDSKRSYNNFTKIYTNAISYTPVVASDGSRIFNYDASNQIIKNYPFYVASRAGKIDFGKFTIKEFMIYNRALTDEEVQVLQDGYQKKYKLN